MGPAAMGSSAAVWLVLLASLAAAAVAVAAVAANLPFPNERLLMVGLLRAPKQPGWRLIEPMLLGYPLLGVGAAPEANAGQSPPQGWECHVAIGFLFMTLAFPGFVWCCRWRQP